MSHWRDVTALAEGREVEHGSSDIELAKQR